MPQINSDGTITIPADIVKNMDGSAGQEVVFEEWLEPYIGPDKVIDVLKTLEVSVMLRSEWDKELENRAQPLRKLKDREWLCGVHFALSQCFTDSRSIRILNELDDIDPSSPLRKEQVAKIIEELFDQ